MKGLPRKHVWHCTYIEHNSRKHVWHCTYIEHNSMFIYIKTLHKIDL